MKISKRLLTVIAIVSISITILSAQGNRTLLKMQNDSLSVIINHLIKQNDELIKLNMSPSLSQDEKDIQALVYTMQNSWADLTKSKNSNEIIAYFQNEFIVNYIEVDTENRGKVARYTKENFNEFLEKGIKDKADVTYEFESVIFLDIEIKGDLYFNVIYKSMINDYKGDVQIGKRTSFITITGRKMDGDWKIANYSWVSFKYPVNNN